MVRTSACGAENGGPIPLTYPMKELDLLIEQSTSAQQLGMIYRAALDSATSFVKKPSELEKSQRGLTRSTSLVREIRSDTKSEFQRRSQAFKELGATTIEAANLAAKSLRMQLQLEQTGGTYGEKAVNFVLDPLKLRLEQLKQIERTALDGFEVLKSIPTLETQKPNGARVDIVIGRNGPKIIEINTQWVDAFGILDSLNTINGGACKPLEALAKFFNTGTYSKLGVIFINSARGSRETGEKTSLEFMTKNLVQRKLFNYVELLDPLKYRPDYIKAFPLLYVDGDPRMINPGMTDLITLLRQRSPGTVFPLWCPKYEEKSLLVFAYAQRPDLFATTYPFTGSTPLQNFLLKGDSFSSKKVALTDSVDYGPLFTDATQFPNEYVFQEKIESISLPPTWVFDTSSNKPRLIKAPNCKFNVWIVGGKIAGIMTSLSEEIIISDKDYNCVPIAV